jgi:hypothetical protein
MMDIYIYVFTYLVYLFIIITIVYGIKPPGGDIAHMA